MRFLTTARRVVAATVLTLTALVLAAPAASAHATLLFTTPAVDTGVPDSPPAIGMVFDEPVALSDTSVRLRDSSGQTVPTGTPALRRQGLEVQTPIAQRLPPGVYVVDWQVGAPDGDVMAGRFRFAVGTAQALVPQGVSTVTKGFGWTAGLRWILFAAYAIALGGLAGRRLLRPVATRLSLTAPGSGALPATAVALAAAAGLATLIAVLARPAALVSTRPGLLALGEATALGSGVLLLALRRERLHRVVAGLLALVAVAEGARAHPQSAVPGWGVVTLTVHLLAAALWAGMLVYILRTSVAWRGDASAVRKAFRAYARTAGWLFTVVVVTGTVNALLLVPLDALLESAYARLLLAKLALVVIAASAALASRLRLRSRPDPGRVTNVEVGALTAVLAVTALLTVVTPPATANPALPFPPTPVGPVLATGTRAGTIGIAATASTGQLVLDLSTPTVAGEPEPEFQVKANLVQPRQKPRPLRLRGCGTGCFLANPTWAHGDNTVTVHAEAVGQNGGEATLLVSWPIRPAPNVLPSVASTMRRLPSCVLHERVTSDTNQDVGPPRSLRISGRDFIEGEPYAGGAAPIAALVSRSGRETTLALGYPAEGVSIRLTLDDTGRLLRETLVAPNHLVERTFTYPEAP